MSIHATTKPLPGAIVDRANPLVPTSAWLFNEGCGRFARDTAGTDSTVRVGTPTWGNAPSGGSSAGGFTSSSYFPTTRYPLTRFSVVGRACLDSIVSYSCLYGAVGGGYFMVIWNAGTYELWSAGEYAGSAMGSAVTAGRWFTFAITRAGNSVTDGYKLYYNGRLAAKLNTTTPTAVSNPFWIGMRSDGYAHPWLGKIDYLYWYNRCLSDQEVSEVHAKPFGFIRNTPLIGRSPTLVQPAGTTTQYPSTMLWHL